MQSMGCLLWKILPWQELKLLMLNSIKNLSARCVYIQRKHWLNHKILDRSGRLGALGLIALTMGCANHFFINSSATKESLKDFDPNSLGAMKLSWLTQDQIACNGVYSPIDLKIIKGNSYCVNYMMIDGESVCTIVTNKMTTHLILGEAVKLCKIIQKTGVIPPKNHRRGK
jgi:hypothetical protein